MSDIHIQRNHTAGMYAFDEEFHQEINKEAERILKNANETTNHIDLEINGPLSRKEVECAFDNLNP